MNNISGITTKSLLTLATPRGPERQISVIGHGALCCSGQGSRIRRRKMGSSKSSSHIHLFSSVILPTLPPKNLISQRFCADSTTIPSQNREPLPFGYTSAEFLLWNWNSSSVFFCLISWWFLEYFPVFSLVFWFVDRFQWMAFHRMKRMKTSVKCLPCTEREGQTVKRTSIRCLCIRWVSVALRFSCPLKNQSKRNHFVLHFFG